MKYINEYTGASFDNANDCLAAEREFLVKQENEKNKREQAAAKRKEAAAKVEAARKAMNEAQSTYKKELEAFCKEYGTYHTTLTGIDSVPHLFDIFNLFS